ncbi:hypothetical protein [Bacillus suaedae]|uniref:HK97 gp10 family phage protein n=1 Tax=Halalkalibacter suaedae TaxID=2822140 RepID=A0A940WV98_9BACI|nr:hypothetical protein [Bacillus suaedae]MBP3951127.1 hypothetical protein [Bacillus suaedae]
MTVRFEFDYKELSALEDKLRKLPDNVEKIINDVLHKTGIELVTDSIIERMPLSDKKKKHAKTSKPFRSEKFNLGFEIKPKRQFYYLVFPNDALGTSLGKNEQEFMEIGLERSINKIVEEINAKADEKLKEELK